MAKQGFKVVSSNPFSYIQLASGSSSVAVGIDNVDSKFKIQSKSSTGAVPTGTVQLTIDPSANGNITLSPNGSGSTIIGNGGLIVSDLTAGIVSTDAMGIFSSNATTNHALQVGNASSNITSLAVGSTGTVLIGNSAADPSFSATPSVTMITITDAPVAGTDGVNKTYADAIASGITYKTSAVAATTTNLNATYANGASGVGATLTNAGALVAFSVDGVSPSVSDRVLVKNQTTESRNGIYTVTTVGSGAVAWVLTRATDYDTAVEIKSGTVVPVTGGSTQSNTAWLQTQTVVTVGTDPIEFVQFTFNTNAFLQVANNLSDVASASTSRTNLGLTNVAIQNVTQYSILVGGASNAITSIANGATGQVLHAVTGSNDPVWSAVSLTADVSGILPVANGGTGSSSGPQVSITGNTGGALTSNAFTFSGGTTGLSFGGSGTTETLTFAGITANGGAVSLATDATTSTINVGTGAGIKTTTLGSTNSTSATTVQSGSGGIALTGAVTSANAVTVTSGAITASSGNIVATSGNITLAATSSSSIGSILIGGNRFMHAYGQTSDDNTFIGQSSGNYTLTLGTAVWNTGVGHNTLSALTTGQVNTCIGKNAGAAITTSSNNTLIGTSSGNIISTGSGNNIMLGYAVADQLTSGAYNVLLGVSTGHNYTSSESSNILIGYGVQGTVAESNILRIGGGTGTSAGQINQTTICGITGKTSTTGIAVLVNSSNVLGTTTSSRRFKDNIQDMAEQSGGIYNLRPVTFTYKPDDTHVSQADSLLKQYGLIAEEVDQVIPNLVSHNKDGEIESVRYLNLIPMLLNELQKLKKEIDIIKGE